jgi:hypothetical protein|tara:strand:- start:15690 stop:16346 length:657 start_codon:yes stop_codon:yes gene_type:complete
MNTLSQYTVSIAGEVQPIEFDPIVRADNPNMVAAMALVHISKPGLKERVASSMRLEVDDETGHVRAYAFDLGVIVCPTNDSDNDIIDLEDAGFYDRKWAAMAKMAVQNRHNEFSTGLASSEAILSVHAHGASSLKFFKDWRTIVQFDAGSASFTFMRKIGIFDAEFTVSTRAKNGNDEGYVYYAIGGEVTEVFEGIDVAVERFKADLAKLRSLSVTTP